MISTVMASSAYAACGINKLGDCDKSSCEGLSKENGVKYEFNESIKKCMSKDIKVSTTGCPEGADGKRTPKPEAGSAPGKAEETKTIVK